MNAMPVERVPMKQPKQQVSAVTHENSHEYANYANGDKVPILTTAEITGHSDWMTRLDVFSENSWSCQR